VIGLREDWRFRFVDVPATATETAYSDADCKRVAVPHSWSRVGVYQPNVATRIKAAESVNKASGTGWYRKQFALPGTAKGRRVWLEFDTASRIASAWLNGRFVGEHKGGYSRFRLAPTSTS
jgi:beta-galactosidase